MISSTKAYNWADVEAVVYPACECGEPWAKHGACGGYRPSRPVVNYGTVSFQSRDLIANVLWKLELFFKTLRQARVRNL